MRFVLSISSSRLLFLFMFYILYLVSFSSCSCVVPSSLRLLFLLFVFVPLRSDVGEAIMWIVLVPLPLLISLAPLAKRTLPIYTQLACLQGQVKKRKHRSINEKTWRSKKTRKKWKTKKKHGKNKKKHGKYMNTKQKWKTKNMDIMQVRKIAAMTYESTSVIPNSWIALTLWRREVMC